MSRTAREMYDEYKPGRVRIVWASQAFKETNDFTTPELIENICDDVSGAGWVCIGYCPEHDVLLVCNRTSGFIDA